MVINDANALLSGAGTIDGVSHNFILSIIDGDLQSPAGPDLFRIRITRLNGTLYYDNEFAPIPTADIMLTDPRTGSNGPIVIGDSPSGASVGTHLVFVGNVPPLLLAQAGLDHTIFLPALAD